MLIRGLSVWFGLAALLIAVLACTSSSVGPNHAPPFAAARMTRPELPGTLPVGIAGAATGRPVTMTLAGYRSAGSLSAPLGLNEAPLSGNFRDILRGAMSGLRGQIVRLTVIAVSILTVVTLAVAVGVAGPADFLAAVRGRLPRPVEPAEPKEVPVMAIAPGGARSRRWRWSIAVVRWMARDGTVIFFVALAINVVVGYYLVFYDHFLPGDAQSRVADAFFVLFSRDPHLAAIGFIWPPLPSFMELPIVAFKAIWPQLVVSSFAGSIQTAICGAGTAAVINAFFRNYGFRPPLRWLFVAAYVLNPMVLMYNSNGMSEAMFIFCLVTSTYLFLRWTETRRTSFLVGLAFVTALGIFVRYEMWLFALLMGFGVLAMVLRRLQNYRETETRTILYAMPVVYAAVLWLMLNLVIKRDALYFFHGGYTPTQLGTGKGIYTPIETYTAAAAVVLERTINLYPAYYLGFGAVVLVAIVARRLRAGLTLALVSTAALLMQLQLIHAGNSFLDLRYFMTVIPFAFVFVAFALGQVRPWWLRLPLAVPLLAILLASNAFTLLTMADRHYFDENFLVAAAIKGVPSNVPNLEDFQGIAEKINQVPGNSLVALDTFTGFAIVTASSDPQRFVVTSDRDFEAAIAEPSRHNVKYFVVPQPVGRAAEDRFNQAYPSLWASGGGFAVLEKDLGSGFRLYRVTSAPR
jgi:hypothetical protein